MCPINNGAEDMEHRSLHCPSFDEEQRGLLAGAFALLSLFGYTNPLNKFRMEPLCYGD